MKRRFSKILGVGLTLALLTSLLLTAAPVSALTTPSVTVDPTTISEANAEYAIRFELDEQLTGGSSVTVGATAGAPGDFNLAEIGDSFVITATATNNTATIPTPLDNGTVTITKSTLVTVAGDVYTFNAIGETVTVTVATVDATNGRCDENNWTWVGDTAPTVTVTTGDDVADTITIVFPPETTVDTAPTLTMLAGPGWINGVWTGGTTTSTPYTGVCAVDTTTVVITLDQTNKDRIGEGAEVRLSFTAGITNPDEAGTYNLTVETSEEDAVVVSTAHTPV